MEVNASTGNVGIRCLTFITLIIQLFDKLINNR